MASAWLKAPIAWDDSALQAFGGGAPSSPLVTPAVMPVLPTKPPPPRRVPGPVTRAPVMVTRAPVMVTRTPPAMVTPALPAAFRAPNVVVFVHAESWMSSGELKVLSIRGTGPTIETFTSRDLAQVFAVEGQIIRNVVGQGQMLQVDSVCSTSGTYGGRRGSWSFKRVGAHQLQYELRMACTEGPKKLSGDLSLVPADLEDPQASWFVVPVGALAA